MLEFRNVSKSFWTGTQRKVILDRASFRVEIGQSLGILAPNGTGKTTLINMMAGLEKPAISRSSTGWTPTISRRSAAGSATLRNISTAPSAPTVPA